ncbi:MAG TPA: rhomboid family intramembrane serine protease [Candidatus Angelobacter sp.]|nr:rhomboid family intramembrane serine protease [Candidatus Angelobacter sp.]
MKCGAELPVNEEGVAPVLCDRCAGVASGRARRTIATGTMRDYPVTTALTAINVAVFVGMVATGAGFLDFSGQAALAWGANVGPYTLNGEWWRLITAGFVHGGLMHIAFNMWCLWSLGQLSERLFGRFQTLFIYLLTGVGGALLSIAHNSRTFEVGASGAIFGIAGALLAGVKFGNLAISAGQKRSVVSSMVFFVGINFALGAGLMGNIFGANIDNFCHLGGFITGLLMGVPLGGFAQRHKLYQWFTILVMTVVLVFGYNQLEQKYGIPADVRQALHALDGKDYARAIYLLEHYTKSNPDDDRVWGLLGSLYAENNQRDKAVAAFQQALKVNPDSEEAKQALQDLGAPAAPQDK